MAAPQWTGGKCKSVQQAKAYFRHNDKDRREEMNHANPHIDKSKTHENFTYRGLDYKGLCKAFDDRMAAVDQGKPGTGKNARVVLQSVILYPPKGLTREQEKDWFMDAGRVMEARFGDNLLEIQFDMDEEHEYIDAETGEKVMSRNHGHARLFPEVGGKLNGKAFSSRAAMTGLNHALDMMSVQKYGVHMMDGTGKKGGVSVESLKAASLRAEVEQLEGVRDTILTDAMERADEITAEASRDARAARREADDYAYKARRQANKDAVELTNQAEADAQEIRAAAELDAQATRLQAERDAQAMREQVAAMRRERDEAQADRDAAHQDAYKWAVKTNKLQTAHKSLQTALQGDVRAMEAQQAKQGAVALLDALGATVKPIIAKAAQAVRVPPSVTPGPVAGSVLAELMRQIAARDAQRRDAQQDGPELG